MKKFVSLCLLLSSTSLWAQELPNPSFNKNDDGWRLWSENESFKKFWLQDIGIKKSAAMVLDGSQEGGVM